MFCNPFCLILLLLALEGNCGSSNCNCIVSTCGHKHHGGNCHHKNKSKCGSINIYPKKVKIYVNCND